MNAVIDKNAERLARVREQLAAVLSFAADLSEEDARSPIEAIEFEFVDRRNDQTLQASLSLYLTELGRMCPHAPTGALLKLAAHGRTFGAAVEVVTEALGALDRWIEERSR